MDSVFLYTPQFEAYEYGELHPFKPYRARMVYELCHRYGLLDHPGIRVLEPLAADPAMLRTFHNPGYLAMLEQANDGRFVVDMLPYGLGTADNPVFRGVYEFSLLVTGATLTGARLIADGEAGVVFNPVGGLHHAQPGGAEGFCYVNDIAIAITELLNKGVKRVCYVDVDAHHGNGVQDAFYASDEVLFISLHQSGETIYPGTGFENEMGEGRGLGYTVNFPLPEYTDDEAYLRAFHAVAVPLIDAFAPEVIVAQVGLDTLKKDPLTNMRCTNNALKNVLEQLRRASPRILALGGGGYSVHDVARGWALGWAVLNDIEPCDDYAGLVGGGVYGHALQTETLLDTPHVISPVLRRGVLNYVDEKIAYIKKNLFPLHDLD